MPQSDPSAELQHKYPASMTVVPELENLMGEERVLSAFLAKNPGDDGIPPYLVDLARIEESRYRLLTAPPAIPSSVPDWTINPAIELLAVNWSNLPAFMADQNVEPTPGAAHVLVLIRPVSGNIEIRDADADDLLALKIVAEDMDPVSAAAEGGISVGNIRQLLSRGEQRGLLLSPPSRIRRPPDFSAGEISNPAYFSAPVFTLQWHITQACDLNCRHCYDRSDRETMTVPQALQVLDTLFDFCDRHHVYGQVSFSGGNPMLYPHFNRIYKEAADRGFMTAIIGNPMPLRRVEEMQSIQAPEFYQVSLEGMGDHNDYIRGPGHFGRTIDFLEVLGGLGVYRIVMLTLTRDNMDQVLELAEFLKGRVELFTFNRLASMGEGAKLSSVPPELYPEFLSAYMAAAKSNASMGFKDNLFNLLRWQRGDPVGGGCTGFGCGAAFNFASVLPDGEVHACRKMPSWIGSIYEQSLNDIYHGSLARKYRNGSSGCGGCPIRPVCGGCISVGFGFGRDIFNEVDPYCFFS